MCLSYGCRTKTPVNQFGEIQPGQLVSSTTHTKHCAKDNAELTELESTPSHQESGHFLILLLLSLFSLFLPYVVEKGEIRIAKGIQSHQEICNMVFLTNYY